MAINPVLMVAGRCRAFKSTIIMIALAAGLSACAWLPSFNPVSRGTVSYNATSWCVPLKLKRVLKRVARKYGSVTVTSTYRGWFHNRRVGGARRSLHKKCKAVDFTVKGNQGAVMAYLRRQRAVGGLKKYRNGHIHIDTGKRRSW